MAVPAMRLAGVVVAIGGHGVEDVLAARAEGQMRRLDTPGLVLRAEVPTVEARREILQPCTERHREDESVDANRAAPVLHPAVTMSVRL